MSETLRVVDWIPYHEAKKNPDVNLDKVRGKEAELEVVRAIREQGIRHCGFEHQDTWRTGYPGVPLFNTGEVLLKSLRGWGRLMYQALHPEGGDDFGYCDWAWERPEKEDG